MVPIDFPWINNNSKTIIKLNDGAATTARYVDSLPKWMKDYFEWHTSQLSSQEKINWRHHQLLIVRCMDNDRCGGTSDRLKSVPLFLVLAAKTKRLLFLRWNRPFALEQFLLPHAHWNWTVPSSLSTVIDVKNQNQTTILSKKSQQLVSAVQNPSTWLVQGNLQFSGAALYQKLASELDDTTTTTTTKMHDYNALYHSFFRASFRPAPAIQSIVNELFKTLQLIPNQFVVAHVRAKYPGEVFRETGNLTALEELVHNALCVASKLSHSSSVIYLASDALAVLQAGMRYPQQQQQQQQSNRRNHSVRVVSRLGDSLHVAKEEERIGDPPHLNFAQRDDPSAFYSIFVDLIIMSQAACVTFGAGGFGRFGSLVSFNASCRQAHSVKGVMNKCP